MPRKFNLKDDQPINGLRLRDNEVKRMDYTKKELAMIQEHIATKGVRVLNNKGDEMWRKHE
jgi:hypothetical protein